jgi:hypothetical protein
MKIKGDRKKIPSLTLILEAHIDRASEVAQDLVMN